MGSRTYEALKSTMVVPVQGSAGTRPAASPAPPPPPIFPEEHTVRTGPGRVQSSEGGPRRDRGTLMVVRGPQTGRVVPLPHDVPTDIGRTDDATIPVIHSTVSRKHARVRFLEGRYYLEDLGSANGTFVNGAPVLEVRELRPGDQVRLGAMVSLRFDLHTLREQETLSDLYRSAVRDPLTGLYNREHFEDRLEAETSYALRSGSDLSVLMIDIDHFKRINDDHGHPAGDAALRVLSRTMKRILRPEDLLARMGGEEFALAARGLDERNASILAERLRRQVESTRLRWSGSILRLTISIGIASLRPGAVQTPEVLVSAADSALYEAKESGRNRCVCRS